MNAVEAITYSACFYVFRCLLAEDVPATAGLMRPIEVIAPEGTVVGDGIGVARSYAHCHRARGRRDGQSEIGLEGYFGRIGLYLPLA